MVTHIDNVNRSMIGYININYIQIDLKNSQIALKVTWIY